MPNAIGAGAFGPLHATSDAVTYVDIEAKAHLDDRSGDSSIINTDVAGTTLSTSTRLGYRWINDVGSWMYGVYAGYDTRELKSGTVDTKFTVIDPRTVHFQQVAVGAEAVSNQWSVHAYVLMPVNTTEKQLNSHYNAGALDTAGVDVGYQINDKTKATVGYYHQNGDLGEASSSGVTTGLFYDINDNLTTGIKVSYDDAFETRVMANINYTFGNLIKGDEAQKEAGLNWLMNALNASPEQRDIRVHDGINCLSPLYYADETKQTYNINNLNIPLKPHTCQNECDCDGTRKCDFSGGKYSFLETAGGAVVGTCTDTVSYGAHFWEFPGEGCFDGRKSIKCPTYPSNCNELGWCAYMAAGCAKGQEPVGWQKSCPGQ